MLYIINQSNCITLDDGNLLYNIINNALERKRNSIITINFSNVKVIASPYINAAFGQLFEHYSRNIIDDNLLITGLSEKHMLHVKLIMNHAKRYYNDDIYRNAIDTVMKEMAEEN